MSRDLRKNIGRKSVDPKIINIIRKISSTIKEVDKAIVTSIGNVDTMDSFLQKYETSLRNYTVILDLQKKDQIPSNKDFEELTKKFGEFQKKVYIQLFNEHCSQLLEKNYSLVRGQGYSQQLIKSISKKCEDHLTALNILLSKPKSELKNESLKNGISFWSARNLGTEKQSQNSEMPTPTISQEVVLKFKAIKEFNEKFKSLNYSFADIFKGGDPHRLKLTESDKAEFENLCEVQKNFESKIAELEAREEVKQILSGDQSSQDEKENWLDGDNIQ